LSAFFLSFRQLRRKQKADRRLAMNERQSELKKVLKEKEALIANHGLCTKWSKC
jgi:hypothetical protein